MGGAKCAHDNSKHGAKSSSLATFRVKEGGVERFVVELIKMGGRVKHARIVSVETILSSSLNLSTCLYL